MELTECQASQNFCGDDRLASGGPVPDSLPVETDCQAEIDQQTMEVEHYHLVGQRVWNLALSPDESRLYTTNGVSSDVSVIDLEEGRVIKTVGVGRLPWGVVVRP